ncbi:MAG: hypothetical protein U0R80_05760 [Nocardioidaceae bacterium]
MRVDSGATVALHGTTVADEPGLAGVVELDELEPFSDAAAAVEGRVQLSAVRAGDDSVVVTLRVTEISGGTLDRVDWSMPGPVTETDVDFHLDGLGDVGPSRVSRVDGADDHGGALLTLGFVFDPPVTPEASSRFVHVVTGARDFHRAGTLALVGRTTSGAPWRTDLLGVAATPLQLPQTPSTPVIGTVGPPLTLDIDVDALAALPSGLVVAAGHPPTYPEPDRLVRVVVLDVGRALPRQLVSFSVPDSEQRQVHALLAGDRHAFLVIQHVESTYRGETEVVTLDLADPASPRVVSRTGLGPGLVPIDAALAGGAVWVGMIGSELAGVDVRDPDAPRALPRRPLDPDLARLDGWVAGGGERLHLAADLTDGRQAIVSLDVGSGPDAPRRISVLPLDEPCWGLAAAPGIAATWDTEGLILFRPRSRGDSEQLGTVRDLVATAVLTSDPARLFTLLLAEPQQRIEVRELAGGASSVMAVAEFPGTEQPHAVRPRMVLAGDTLCFTVVRELRTVTVTGALLQVQTPADRPDLPPPSLPPRVPRPPR